MMIVNRFPFQDRAYLFFLLMVNTPDWTPLLSSCSAGKYEVVKYLLEQPEIQVNHMNKMNCSSLHYACKGFPQIVDLLIEHNAQLNVKNKYGETPLHRAVASRKLGIVNRLIEEKANIDTQNRYVDPLFHNFSISLFYLIKIKI